MSAESDRFYMLLRQGLRRGMSEREARVLAYLGSKRPADERKPT